MPIILNGTGTISGLTAGGLPSSSVTTANIADNAVTYAKIGTTEQGQLCKAWVNFNGTSTVAIRASYNVSSITDNGVGDYTVNFTTALADTNCAVIATSQYSNTRGDAFSQHNVWAVGYMASTTSANIQTVGGAYNDCATVAVAIFR